MEGMIEILEDYFCVGWFFQCICLNLFVFILFFANLFVPSQAETI